MKLITKEIARQLDKNYLDPNKDEVLPAVKFFHPMNYKCIWLISERDPKDHDLLFGLCDLGMGFPELGYVRLSQLEDSKVMGLGVERDLYWTPTQTLKGLAYGAKRLGSVRLCMEISGE